MMVSSAYFLFQKTFLHNLKYEQVKHKTKPITNNNESTRMLLTTTLTIFNAESDEMVRLRCDFIYTFTTIS